MSVASVLSSTGSMMNTGGLSVVFADSKLGHRMSYRFVAGLYLTGVCGALTTMVIAAGYITPASAKSERVQTDFNYPVGSIVIVNNERKVYYVTAKGEAVRYPVAVGKQSELWMGRTFVAAKQVDPKWIPVNGDDPVEGGAPGNPLGKRALYLDWSLLRIHGTPSRGSIGSAVSNGCIRMLNEDVVDLFERVHLGAPVYAVSSRKDAERFEQNRIAEKIYANPAAREAAKAEELEAKAEEERERREASRERSGTPKFASRYPPDRFVSDRFGSERSAQRTEARPPSWYGSQNRSGLGRFPY
jgi:lipoprotein-anchoring transpeptidase ErfK/SrfK